MLWSACGVVWPDALSWPWAVPPKLVKLVNLVKLIILRWGLALGWAPNLVNCVKLVKLDR